MATRPGEGVGVLVLRVWTERDEPRFRARLTSRLDVEDAETQTTVVATPAEAVAAVAAWLRSGAGTASLDRRDGPDLKEVRQAVETNRLRAERDDIAPDGSDVRILLGVEKGGMAHFELAPNQTSVAVAHRTVEEIWYFLEGRGQMWRRRGEDEEVVDVSAGVCINIPVGTEFQFRSLGYEPLSAIGVTIPPWPGSGEARFVDGRWEPTVAPGAA